MRAHEPEDDKTGIAYKAGWDDAYRELAHELSCPPDKLVERVRQTAQAMRGLLTVDWNLERGDFYDPTTYAGKVWLNLRAALDLWKPETPPSGEKGGTPS